ncbi:MAG: hypothetical protein AAB344_08295, partial [Bacteroidota bacterium]
MFLIVSPALPGATPEARGGSLAIIYVRATPFVVVRAEGKNCVVQSLLPQYATKRWNSQEG